MTLTHYTVACEHAVYQILAPDAAWAANEAGEFTGENVHLWQVSTPAEVASAINPPHPDPGEPGYDEAYLGMDSDEVLALTDRPETKDLTVYDPEPEPDDPLYELVVDGVVVAESNIVKPLIEEMDAIAQSDGFREAIIRESIEGWFSLFEVAAELHQAHDETGIDLTDWSPVREFVEYWTGGIDEYPDDSPAQRPIRDVPLPPYEE